MAHQAFRRGRGTGADDQAPQQRRCGLALLAIAQCQGRIHLGGGGAHGQLAQRGEVGLAEEGVDGGAGLLGHIDLALAQALQQFPGWQVDEHQFIGIEQDLVRHGFPYLHSGDVAHLVVETFQVLDIDRGVDVDAGGE
ncbi:hypothetical protein QE440_004394 [Pseudomonas psychrotolerans]|uniref:Uncharacterized protein n=1 Tax=Pseudomonas oryzihabitans TaxID=47885 RepID=A0AAJ2EY91_9PSED|nr:hypothetical protein [Pseudomonas psychrotolerans]